MTKLSATLGGMLGDEAQLALDRAASELRAGRPVAVDVDGLSTLTAALDGVSPSMFSTFAALDGGVVALSAHRARTLGVAVDHPIAVPLAGMTRPAALHLAADPRHRTPEHWTSADPGAAGAIALAKSALLLPALLAAPVAPGTELPSGLHRVRLPAAALSVVDRPMEIVSRADVPLSSGIKARFMVFRDGAAPRDQVAVVVGEPDPAQPVLVRLHSACLTGDLFGSMRCDCGDQLRNAMNRLAENGGGVLLYLDQEGRGIGIGNKMRAYALQDDGFDTIDADAVLGFSADERRYECAAAMLHALGYRRITLLTNNPEKIGGLTRAGIEVTGRQSLFGGVTAQNHPYLQTKQSRANHMLEDLLNLTQASGGS